MQMIELVAAAIYMALEPAGVLWVELPQARRGPYLDASVKAIQALRAPTEAMLDEGARRDLPGDAANVWERMIWRALAE